MTRRSTSIPTLAALAFLYGLTPAAPAFGGHGGKGTYHYNGSSGYWAGGGYAGNTACCPTQYVQQATYYAPQSTYYAPQPAYAAPQNNTYAQPQTTWRPAYTRR